MGNIKVMDEALTNKIAAGEVVERVSSVVKELVENSIDAKSSIIKIELIESGVREIKVTDNGIGMETDDAIMSFMPHATSKIKSEMDLYFISSLGFRGEALPSIASVSEVTLITNTDDTNSGVKLTLIGGKLKETEAGDSRKGTIVSVRNLFFNTPARLKFLKSLNTELFNIIYLIENLSLSHPEISFSLSNDGKSILKTSGSNILLKTIHEIYGPSISKNMISVKGENNDFSIEGYVSTINQYKSNRNSMIIFVNNRLVKNSIIIKAIKDAYHTFLAENKYPIVVLNIASDPTVVDVNIHPTKQDVKFSKTEELEDLIFTTIRNKLNEIDNMVNINEGSEEKQYNFRDVMSESFKSPTTVENEIKENKTEDKIVENIEFNLADTGNLYTKEEKHLEVVGLAMGTYLIIQDKDTMYIMDIHAANERINYEKYLKAFKEKSISKIGVLIPITLEYSTNEFLTLKDNLSVLEEKGFKIEEFGNNTFRVIEHPTWIKEGFEEESIKQIFDIVINIKGKFDVNKFNENIAITLACKSSVKANTRIPLEEQEMLLKRIFECEFPYTCPHGRPTIIKYPLYELEKMFKRVVS
jgi:DNA mismatch repair protein MutL